MRHSLFLSLAKSGTRPAKYGSVWFRLSAVLRPPPNLTKPCFLSGAVCSSGIKYIHSAPCSPLRSPLESFETFHSLILNETVPASEPASDSVYDSNSGSDSASDSGGAESEKEAKKSSEKNAKVEGPRFKDLGGMKKVLEQMEDLIFALRFPKLAKSLGGKPVTGLLLTGPPGCGKTKLAHAMANETDFCFYNISAPSLSNMYVGESERKIRELFAKAHKTAPSIVFLDEIDAIASKREDANTKWTKCVVAQLLTCMDEFHRPGKDEDEDDDGNSDKSRGSVQDQRSRYVLVIGATNRPDSLDPALRRPGRFDLEICFNAPDENARVEILKVVTSNLRLEGPLDLVQIARSTPGYVGVDLKDVANRACDIARKRIVQEKYPNLSLASMKVEECNEDWVEEEKEKLTITVADFEKAVQEVQPTLKREGFNSIPNVKWEDVGGLDALRNEFNLHIVSRIKYPEIYEGFGVSLETGFLLYGPPGCGKTLIAKALANGAGANLIQIKGPELLDNNGGDSALAVRTLFKRARACAPCILFFDEVDALTTKRGNGGTAVEKLLNQLLVELDGGEQRKGVIVIGATNRPDAMDPAVLRPGRFGKHIYVPLPNKDERGFILKALARNKPVDASVDLSEIGRRNSCENFSGADLAALMHEATIAAVQEKLISVTNPDASPCAIKLTHFERALAKTTPSLSDKELQSYQKFGKDASASNSDHGVVTPYFS